MKAEWRVTVHTRCAHRFQTAAGDKLAESGEPTESSLIPKVDELRMHNLANRRIPTQTNVANLPFPDVESAARHNRKTQKTVIDVNDFGPFLTASTQRFLPNTPVSSCASDFAPVKLPLLSANAVFYIAYYLGLV